MDKNTGNKFFHFAFCPFFVKLRKKKNTVLVLHIFETTLGSEVKF